MKKEGNKQYFDSLWEYAKDAAIIFDDANTYGEAAPGTLKIIPVKIWDDPDFGILNTYVEKDGIDYAEVSWNENLNERYFVPMEDLHNEFFLVIEAYDDQGYTLWRTLSGILRETEADAQKEIDEN